VSLSRVSIRHRGGSDPSAGVVALGTTTLLSVSSGIGLTRNTPDYVINVALPIRFDLLKLLSSQVK
jgi:hypothetical protein